MKRKNLIIGALIMLAMLVSGFTFAYWTSGITGNNDTATGTVVVGSGDAVTTTVTVGNETSVGPLVPVGVTGINEVDLTFSVLWESDATEVNVFEGMLVVDIVSVLIGGVDYSHLFTVTVVSGDGAITEDSAQDVIINIEFTNEPVDAAEYALVASQSVVITITFTVTPN